ncbi:MAG: hypothetical protein A2504_05845 [Bdellovibrionales bacterium RIFOXYD12_FULL_39_22]|nr:MAG: hypothetical protein A2385_05980 [Bdellovibrionales bacterium RIFOXYB1_FULL_39_21]OFZ41828.1 MAG: hypothetical protein A2485_07950 [Bdellovibrionales bacterium RIFOXYC12_FULL_39_17]OFZ50544.1 MAG: hypothetical protein A2404_04900 [Bdellovibrionales bacterium RIFOXYC1_FULL_39_130]OFZ68576.1 MAG: hypothetical protein A2451_16145 [Bdellovibrionales bacterium RIFOXYC2_FULL_39_8]OFZ77767.1 MAG: hypothetical protein A2560_00070 [Bdellovibrionales bacterium RIFOXYD1_FULL_39_84]OFZ93797.1 MAG:
MKLSFLYLLIISALFLVIGCGGGNSKKEDKSYTDSQFQEGDCGSSVIYDYNSMVLTCSDISSQSDIKECDNKIGSLKKKYPDISCKAIIENESEKGPVTINEARLNSISEKLEIQKGICTDDVISDYNIMVNYCKNLTNYSTSHSVYMCKNSINELKINYPNINCIAKSDSSFSEIEISIEKLDELLDVINDSV